MNGFAKNMADEAKYRNELRPNFSAVVANRVSTDHATASTGHSDQIFRFNVFRSMSTAFKVVLYTSQFINNLYPSMFANFLEYSVFVNALASEYKPEFRDKITNS